MFIDAVLLRTTAGGGNVARLSLSLLGPFQVTLDGQPIIGFKSNKVRALLAYLAVEADRPHRRETLAGLLWPDWPDRDALSNLRYALSNLRHVIDDHTAIPPFLLINRENLQFNTDCDFWLDVNALTLAAQNNLDDAVDVELLERSINLYRGSFLEGFSLEDSSPFEDWIQLTRERLARQASSILHALANIYERSGAYEHAQSFAWRQLELEPCDESAHRLVMRTHVLSGQRSAALAQFEICQNLLSKELGVEPSAETRQLYEQIRNGMLKPTSPPVTTTKRPLFLQEEPVLTERHTFVARKHELMRLNEFLERALTGQGGVVFVTGEAGSGKTTIIQEFTRRAQDEHPDLCAASGNCNAYTGIGDPYLPFREILELFSGDVESRWAAGNLTLSHAHRLWDMLPVVSQALVDAGPDLIDTFILRTYLIERARTYAPSGAEWLTHLQRLLENKHPSRLSMSGPLQVDLFEQYTKLLQTLAQKNPLLLVLDDLQWADLGSISLLFHLGRRLIGNRILIVGAYRPEEVALEKDGERHALEPIINEFRRMFGNILVNIDQTDEQVFLDALLDSEPNRLDTPFRDMLRRQTRGHPLFTIELLRGLQERGDLIHDDEGYWVEGSTLNWENLPERVEAAIQERIGRLPEALHKALTVASIEGEFFTAEVVARVQGIDEREILERLSRDLDRRHRLIQAQSIQRVDGQLLSRYRFRHILFQKYLYSIMDEVERVHLHEQVGNTLEALHQTELGTSTITVELARHFEEARVTEKAVHYLIRSGERAEQLSAYQEAIAHLNKSLVLLKTLPDTPERAQKEIDLQLELAKSWQGYKGAQILEVEDAYLRALELCQRTKNIPKLAQVLGGLAVLHYVRADYQEASDLANEALQIAKKVGEPFLVLLCHWYLGFIHFCLGNYTTSLENLRQVTNFYDPKLHHQSLVFLRGSDAGLGAMAYESCCLWCLGYPEQALKRSQKALELAQDIGHPFSLADVLCFAGCMLNAMRRDATELMKFADKLIKLTGESKLVGWIATGIRYRGEAFALKGQFQEGITEMRKGLVAMRDSEALLYFPATLGALALAQAKIHQADEGFSTIDEALEIIEQTGERQWEAELHRIKGILFIIKNDVTTAEISFKKALDIAQKQRARSLELRATVSLSRLWKNMGKRTEARQLLAKTYNWFTEGFDTPDLIEAKELLDELS